MRKLPAKLPQTYHTRGAPCGDFHFFFVDDENRRVYNKNVFLFCEGSKDKEGFGNIEQHKKEILT